MRALRFGLTPRCWLLLSLISWSATTLTFGQESSSSDEPPLSPETVLPDLLHRDNLSADIRLALQNYLREIEDIETELQQKKAQATERFLRAIQQLAPEGTSGAGQKLESGLIGQAVVQGDPSGVVYHYHPGKLFPHSKIRKILRPDNPDVESPHVTITLTGYIVLREKTAVKIYHAAGGVNGDHGDLVIGNRRLGVVGDDTAKAVIYETELPAGKHAITWKLTGGLFQNNLLQIKDAKTDKAIAVGFDALQKGKAVLPVYRQLVVVDHDPLTWSKASDPSEWTHLPLNWSELPQVPVTE